MPSTHAINVAETATLSVSNNGMSTEDIASGRNEAVGSENLFCRFGAKQIDERTRLGGVTTALEDCDGIANGRRRRNVDSDLDLVAQHGSVRRVDEPGVDFLARDIVQHLPDVQRKNAS